MTVNATIEPIAPIHLGTVGSLLGPLVAAVAYYLGAQAAFAIGTLTHQFAPFWPPNIVLLCAFLYARWRHWPLYIAAAFAAHILVEQAAGMPLSQLLLAFVSNVSVTLLNAATLRLALPADEPPLGNLRGAALYLSLTALLNPALVAFVAAFEPVLGGGVVADYWQFWWRWYLANALGYLTLMPLLLTCLAGRVSPSWVLSRPSSRLIEAALLGVGLAASCALAFEVRLSGDTENLFPAVLYLPLPFVLVAAVRFGSKGASGAIVVLTCAVLYAAMHGHQPFVGRSAGNVTAVQLFLAVIAIPAILLAALVEELRSANTRLSNAIHEANGAARTARNAERLLQSSLDAMTTQIAILDGTGKIIAANARWQKIARRIAASRRHHFVGDSYLEGCERGGTAERAIAAGLYRVIDGELPEFRHEYASDFLEHHWFQMRGARFGEGDDLRLVVSHENITEVKNSEAALRNLSGRLMQAQDQERRRIARELHDSTAQNLLGAMLGIQQVKRHGLPRKGAPSVALDESLELIDLTLREIRTVAYLLHPPMLDEAGLPAALSWFCDGFARRTDLPVSVTVSPDIGRLPADIEAALFRVVQEGLTNAHRHSGGTKVILALSRVTKENGTAGLELSIGDDGKGMPPGRGLPGSPMIGIGLAGMRERLNQFGGRLEIQSTSRGTVLNATIPLPADDVLHQAVSYTAAVEAADSGSNIQRTTKPAITAPAIGASQNSQS